ncbi:hypothetical protein VE00_10701 [Pseudogymnoascus sp. WSF 3629]|nr:hypothetical protein VE00_10701 [Pseudogymnoascus sp. WSF 3629]
MDFRPYVEDTSASGPEQPAQAESKTQVDSIDELHQDVVSQFPFLNGYSHIVFLFQPDADTSRETIIATVHAALAKLTAQVPWLAGQVLHNPGPPGNSGHYMLAPWPLNAHKNDMVRVEDCEDRMPPIAQIVRAGAPISMLDAKILTPFPSLPLPHGLEPPLPVMLLQVNFLRGGVIINLSTHHMAVDGNGIVQIMRLLATVLQGQEIAAADREQANRDRRRVVPLIPRGEPVKDHSHLRAPPGHITVPPSSPPKWCYFKLPVSALPTLKKLASPPSQQQQLSENDVICALCWQRITAIRLARGFSPDTMTKMTRIIDARAALGVPITYMGHLTYYAVAQLPMRLVASLPLSSIAQTLRRELNAANTTWAIRSYATFLAREPDKSRLAYAGLRNLDTDLGTTAFTASQSTSHDDGSAIPEDFGPVLGHLRYTRRPNCSPLVGGITICPVESGAIPIVMCLPGADLEGLEKDREWRRYARYIG